MNYGFVFLIFLNFFYFYANAEDIKDSKDVIKNMTQTLNQLPNIGNICQDNMTNMCSVDQGLNSESKSLIKEFLDFNTKYKIAPLQIEGQGVEKYFKKVKNKINGDDSYSMQIKKEKFFLKDHFNRLDEQNESEFNNKSPTEKNELLQNPVSYEDVIGFYNSNNENKKRYIDMIKSINPSNERWTKILNDTNHFTNKDITFNYLKAILDDESENVEIKNNINSIFFISTRRNRNTIFFESPFINNNFYSEMSSYMDYGMLKKFKDNTESMQNYAFIFNDNRNINISVPREKNNNFALADIEKMAKKAHDAMKIQGLYPTAQEVNNLSLVYIPFQDKKLMPQNHVFNSGNINSADAFYDSTRTIRIFREEEHPKLILHEFFHTINGEKNLINKEKSIVFLNNHFAIERIGSDPLNIEESITEGVAQISNIAVTTARTSRPECKNKNEDKKRFIKNLSIEIDYGLFQAAKMLNESGFDSFAEFINPKSTSKRLKESTSAAEYHIIKSLLTYTPDDYLDIITSGGPHENNSKEEKGKLIMDLIKRNSKDKNLQSRIDSYMKAIKEENQKESNLMTNLRMTIIQSE